MLTSSPSSHCRSPSAAELSQNPDAKEPSPMRTAQPLLSRSRYTAWLPRLVSQPSAASLTQREAHSAGYIKLSMAGWSLWMFPAWNIAAVWAFRRCYLEEELVRSEKVQLEKTLWFIIKASKNTRKIRRKLIHHFALKP